MDYISVQEARTMPGLRLVLMQGMPSPWSLASRAVFDLKGIEYTAAAQHVYQENLELLEWSGQVSAPLAAYNDERLLTTPESIILLAERLEPEPRLVPEDPQQRAMMFGLLRELLGENGLAWYRRIAAIGAAGNVDATTGIPHRYGYRDDQFQQADQRCADILALFSRTLSEQESAGSSYLVGDNLTALDLYAAIFLNIMIQPEADGPIPLPDMFMATYGSPCTIIDSAFDDRLKAYRQRIMDQYVETPMHY